MYKTHPCRHFDPASGRPLGACKDGEKCRFIHPADPNWRGSRKEYPYIPRASLATQSYAFRRHQLSSSPGRYRDGRHVKEIVRPSKPDNRGPQMNFRGEATTSGHKKTAIFRRDVQQRDATKENIKVEETPIDQKDRLHMPKENDARIINKDRYMDLNQSSSGKVWDAFMQIARLTRESDILGEQQKKEASKMVTYTAVEKTLSEISNQMGLAVTPQIDQSTLVQQDCTRTIAKNNEIVNKVCKEVVQVFVADVTNAVDKQLQTSLQDIRNEADYLTRDIRKRSSQSGDIGSRREGWTQAGSSWSSKGFDKGAHGTKKRRLHTPSPYSRRSASKEGHSMPSEIMKELEAKIERQAQALVNLAQENEKLRAQNQSLSTNSPAP